jgi:hypothetical protein
VQHVRSFSRSGIEPILIQTLPLNAKSKRAIHQ